MNNSAAGFIDFHAHILPGADHGSSNLKTSFGQLQSAAENGVSTIVATPHFYPERHNINDFLLRRENSFNMLMDNYKGIIEIIPAAEVLICEGLNNLREISKLCIRGTNTMLLEMPSYKWTNRLIDTIYKLEYENKIKIILVHVDRYPAKDVDALLREGFKGQINAEAVLRPLRRGKYIKWIEQGSVVALGSDIHGNGSNYLSYRKAAGILKRNGVLLQDRMHDILKGAVQN